jgi:hypothetical protein
MKAAVMIVSGTCVSMGVTVEDMPAKQFQDEVREGKWDSQLEGNLRED